jgi:predicted CXXCH cytochrome family protein
LQRSEEYGKLALLNVRYFPRQAKSALQDAKGEDASPNPAAIHWDAKLFGDRCAGCHATAVDASSRAFSSLSLDCFVCHGDVDPAHTKDSKAVLLSSLNRNGSQVISLCGQCHLRGGKSKTSGLPYPHTFVAGDNLFRDFQVDLSPAATEKLPPIDQHIFANARDVFLLGDSKTTCLSCHEVHGQSSERHQQLDSSAICLSCHGPDPANGELRKDYQLSRERPPRSSVCDYE